MLFKLTLITPILYLLISYEKCMCRDNQDFYTLFREERKAHEQKECPSGRSHHLHVPLWSLLFLIILSTVCCLIVLGIIKGVIGLYCCAPIGMWGLGMLIDLPRPLEQYQEASLAHKPVRYDETGWPVHPDTGQRSVRAITRQTEFYLNIIFFLAYPLAMIITMCSACCFEETADDTQCYRCVNTIVISECADSNKKVVTTQRTCGAPPKQNVYHDEGDSDECRDTQYVVNQLQRSQCHLHNSSTLY